MRLVVLGCNGMVGFELRRSLLPLGEVIALARSQADLSTPSSLMEAVGALGPDVIVNAAAYTEVDRAETDGETADRVNGESVGQLATVAARCGALLVHYSTDYVFDGTGDTPWHEDDATSPVNAYGRSKLLGERALAASSADWLCIRTSWVVASRGRNFVRTILRLAAEREELRVIDDQSGAPTSARNLADVTAQVIAVALRERREHRFAPAMLHYASAGTTTWHGVAVEALAVARSVSPTRDYPTRRILPIATSEYPTPARRPVNSRLSTGRIQDRFGIIPVDWRVALRLCIEEMS